MFDRVRDLELIQSCTERGTPALGRITDNGDSIGCFSGSEDGNELTCEELGGAASSSALQKAKRRVERRSRRGAVGEELALEVKQSRRRAPIGRPGKLLDRARSKTRKILDRPLESREGCPSRLVGDRDCDIGPRGQGLQQGPLGSSQILEAVREDGLVVPGVEICSEPLDSGSSESVTISEVEPVELCSIRSGKPGKISLESIGIEEGGIELAKRGEQSVGESARCSRSLETVELACCDRPSRREGSLNFRRDRAPIGAPGSDVLEQIVERADAPRKQGGPTPDEIALDALDVGAVRDDEPRISIEHLEVPLEEQRDFAGMRRTNDEREAHGSMVVPALDALSYAVSDSVQRARNFDHEAKTAEVRPGTGTWSVRSVGQTPDECAGGA